MPQRPQISAPKFGKWLELCRGDRSLEQIAGKIRPLVDGVGLKVDRSAIKKFEQGRVPSWPMIGALSRVYGVPVEETILRLTEALEFPAARDLLRHGSTGQRADVPAEARIRELEGRLDAYEVIINRAHVLGVELGRITVIGEKSSEAVRPTTKRSRRH